MSQQYHKYFFQYSTFATERPRVAHRGSKLASCPGRHQPRYARGHQSERVASGYYRPMISIRYKICVVALDCITFMASHSRLARVNFCRNDE